MTASPPPVELKIPDEPEIIYNRSANLDDVIGGYHDYCQKLRSVATAAVAQLGELESAVYENLSHSHICDTYYDGCNCGDAMVLIKDASTERSELWKRASAAESEVEKLRGEIARRDKLARPMTLCQKHQHLGLMITTMATGAACPAIPYCPHCETEYAALSQGGKA